MRRYLTLSGILGAAPLQSRRRGKGWAVKEGDLLIGRCDRGDADARLYVSTRLLDGLTYDDIRAANNLSQRKRDRLVRRDNAMRELARSAATTAGMTQEDAIVYVNRIFPFYGEPDGADETSEPPRTGADRPLCWEIALRVRAWMRYHGLNPDRVETYQRLGKLLGMQFGTVNSLIRHEMSAASL